MKRATRNALNRSPFRDPRAAAADARTWAGPSSQISVARAWRMHCDTFPDTAVSLSTWRRYWRAP